MRHFLLRQCALDPKLSNAAAYSGAGRRPLLGAVRVV
jgi:hypothetical protein